MFLLLTVYCNVLNLISVFIFLSNVLLSYLEMPCDQPKILYDVLKSSIKQSPVTCIKFFGKYVIGAVGGDLLVYEPLYKTHPQFKRICVFNIFPSEIIYGIVIKNIKILVFGGRKAAFIETKEDFSCALVTISWTVEDWILDCVWTGDFEIAFLTAHNVLILYQCFPSATVISRINCMERCILYSGKILNSKWEELIIFSGTVYQEVIIWSSGKSISQQYPVIHRLKGHKGVIFSISYDEETQRISSTSDDRTVRVWCVKFPGSVSSVDNWVNAQIVLSFSAFGHTARVWRSLFIPEGQLMSVGEDSQICLWNKDGDLLSRWEHNGDIWCMDYNNSQVAIGGNGIIIRSVLPLPLLLSVTLSQKYGVMRNAGMSFNGNRVIITDEGNLILYRNHIIDIIEEKLFHSYCTFSISPCKKYVTLGGIHGEIVLFKVLENNFIKLCKVCVTGRVYSLTWADYDTIISCGVDGSLRFWKLLEACDGVDMIHVIDFILPQSKERWITCSLLFNSYLICGDRMGSLHLYSLSSNMKDPVDSLCKLHDGKGVSDIKHISEVIYSTGRDGFMRELTVLDDKLILLSTLKLPMDWATSVVHTNTYGLIIMGFYGSNFILWSVDERMTLLQLDCGGGHRSFDCVIDEKCGNLIISYLRMKELKYLSCPLDRVSHQTVLPGYHKKTINCCCLLSSGEKTACIMTGSEDNSLKLCRIDQSGWMNTSTYIRHISSVRTADVVDDILVTAGSRAQMILWHIQNHSGETRLMEIESHMLRKESEHRRCWRKAEPLIDPETRYMDLKIVNRNDGSYTIFSGCSDGMLRIFSHEKQENKLKLIDTLDSDQGCLLKLSVFKWQDEPVVITGGTRGTVSFWYPPYNTKPYRSHSLHSLGINSMDSMMKNNHLILCTGGDDTTVVLTAFSLEKTGKESITFSLREHVHSCQVTGLKLTSDYAITIGLDQKLCIFTWTFDGYYFKTSLLFLFNSSILDIHGLLTWPIEQKDQMKILVFGKGFEVLHFDGLKLRASKKL